VDNEKDYNKDVLFYFIFLFYYYAFDTNTSTILFISKVIFKTYICVNIWTFQ